MKTLGSVVAKMTSGKITDRYHLTCHDPLSAAAPENLWPSYLLKLFTACLSPSAPP